MTSSLRRTAVWLVVALAACGGGGSSSAQPVIRVPVGDSPQRGPSDAWVTVVEFADFECPFCRSEQLALTDLEAIYGTDLRLVFKYFPLASIHPHAQAAAVAAECAREQGKFWEMYDLLFSTALDDATLLADAEQVPGLDVTAWQACVVTPGPAARVADDVTLGTSLGVEATPTVAVNGIPVIGAVPENDLRSIIDRARATAVASGIPRADYYDKAVLEK